MTARRPLEWLNTEVGPMPDCARCLDMVFAPFFAEAVYSVAIEHPGSPADIARRAVNTFHAQGHRR